MNSDKLSLQWKYHLRRFSERQLRDGARLRAVRHRVVRPRDAARHERHLLEGLQRLLALRLRQLQQGGHRRQRQVRRRRRVCFGVGFGRGGSPDVRLSSNEWPQLFLQTRLDLMSLNAFFLNWFKISANDLIVTFSIKMFWFLTIACIHLSFLKVGLTVKYCHSSLEEWILTLMDVDWQ